MEIGICSFSRTPSFLFFLHLIIVNRGISEKNNTSMTITQRSLKIFFLRVTKYDRVAGVDVLKTEDIKVILNKIIMKFNRISNVSFLSGSEIWLYDKYNTNTDDVSIID